MSLRNQRVSAFQKEKDIGTEELIRSSRLLVHLVKSEMRNAPTGGQGPDLDLTFHGRLSKDVLDDMQMQRNPWFRPNI